MKNNRIENAVGNIIRDQKNVAKLVAHLDDREKRRALMSAISFSCRAEYHGVVHESIQLLGFRDEEVLVFASAAMAGGRPQMVPGIIRSFCRNTAIARSELGDAARRLISWAERNTWPHLLDTVLDCIELMKEKIGGAEGAWSTGAAMGNQATILTGFVLWLIEDMLASDPRLQKEHDLIVSRIRGMVHDDAGWKLLQESKSRLGGPRE